MAKWTQAGKARRCAGMFAVSCAALTAAGCRHQTQVAYAPPPPPLHRSATAQPRRASAPEATTNMPSVATPTRADDAGLAGFDDTTGTPVLTETGAASWYGPPYHRHAGADGTIFDQNAMTAAHRTLPMGSTVRVTNVATGQSVLVRITDRGPFVPGRVLDLSLGAAKAVGVYRPGVAKVKIEAFAHATTDPAGRWCVQVGAFKSEGDALDLRAALAERYKTSRVIEFTGPTGHWVRVNPAKPDLAHANEVAKWIASPDPAALPYVVRTD